MNGGASFILQCIILLAWSTFVIFAQGTSTTFTMPEKGYCENIWWTGFDSRVVQSQTDATYEDGMSCDVTVRVPGDTRGLGRQYGVAIKFVHFDVDGPDNGTCLDYLQFFEDHERTSALSPRLCGNSLPPDLYVQQESFTFYFSSDVGYRGAGFRFNYSQFLLPSQPYTTPHPPTGGSQGALSTGYTAHVFILLVTQAILLVIWCDEKH